MTHEQTPLDELFEAARSGPVEFDIKHVDKMVSGFPLAPIAFDWSSIINLNSIIMTSVSAFIIAGSFMLYTGSAQEPLSTNSLADPSTSISTESSSPQEAPATSNMELQNEQNTLHSEYPNESSASPIPVSSTPVAAPASDITASLDSQSAVDPVLPIEPEIAASNPEISVPTPLPPMLPQSNPKRMDENQKEFNVSNFAAISLTGSFNVQITQSDTYRVWAEGEDKTIERLKIEVVSNRLKISAKKDNNKKNVCCTSCNEATVYVEMPYFKSLDVAGSGDMTIMDFRGLDDVDLAVAGSGTIEVEGQIEISGKLKSSIAGSGDMNIDGTAESLKLSISGSGEFLGLDLRVQSADIAIAGSGDVGIHAEQDLDISIAGSGDVEYVGSPNIKKSIMGSGDIRRR